MHVDLQVDQFVRSDVTLVVPPFADVYQANLACHLLQACARESGFDVTVVYGNLIFASILGRRNYSQLLDKRLVLEYIFKRHAFDTPPNKNDALLDYPALRKAASVVKPWLDCMADIIKSIRPRIVGSTCSFEQISSSVAVLNLCKAINPNIITIVGGANCEDIMAKGMLSLGGHIDYVANGESEESFPLFLQQTLGGKRPTEPIIQGKRCEDLDDLPLPDYQEYFDQYRSFFDNEQQEIFGGPQLPHESSRGCWWGEKHHCTFCGLNGAGMAFRHKSADHLASELETLFAKYPISRINMVDNIMPHKYFKTLLPRIRQTLPETVSIFYEQKANINLSKAEDLKNARITAIQPGIESLNSHVLKCIDKGTTAAQNIALLRYARTLNIDLAWNLLAGFPGDLREDYEEMSAVIDCITHLQPPDDFGFVRFDRFSPYFNNPEKYGIKNLRPANTYFDLFPEHTNFEHLAYYFEGDYECGAFEASEVVRDLAGKVEIWIRRWRAKSKPILSIIHMVGDQFVLVDTRGLSNASTFEMIDRRRAAVALTGVGDDQQDDLAWALKRQLLVRLDKRMIPLAIAPLNILKEFEQSSISHLVSPRSKPSVTYQETVA